MQGIGFEHYDSFADEASDFDRQVHLLTFGTLQASLEYLSVKVDIEISNLSQQLDAMQDFDVRQRIADDLDITGMYLKDQQRFVRNMALVALSSQLIHTLMKFAVHAEIFSPKTAAGERKVEPGKRQLSEYEKLWNEYKARFGIDFSIPHNASKIEFTKSMQLVRNQIVHAGGYANKRIKPEFVEGDSHSMDAQVRVNDDQLEMFRAKSIDLVRWLADELRKLEIATYQRSSGSA